MFNYATTGWSDIEIFIPPSRAVPLEMALLSGSFVYGEVCVIEKMNSDTVLSLVSCLI
jgi:hypothetical protein